MNPAKDFSQPKSGAPVLPKAAALVRSVIQLTGAHLGVGSCCLVLAFTWSIVIIDRLKDREQFIASANQQTMSFALAIENTMKQSLASFDEMLLTARHTGITPESRPLIKQLGKATGLSDAIDSLSLYDAHGDLMATMAENSHARPNVADRSWFKAFRDNSDDSLFIGPPIVNRVTNQLAMILARGIRKSDGQFQGMVGMAINPEVYGNFFRSLPMGKHGVINLISTDGMIFARVTAQEAIYGAAITTPGLKRVIELSRQLPNSSSYVSSADAVDDIAKYFSWRVIAGTPLIINVGLAESDVLDQYYRGTTVMVVAALIFSIAMIGATLIGQRRMRIIQRQTRNLEHQARSLEDRNQVLQQQSLALAAAMNKAAESDKLKGEFIANMSHELRTPLNAIIGFSALMLENGSGSSSGHSINFRPQLCLERIHAAGRHLLDLVTGVLEMAKLDSGNFEVQPETTDLALLTAECLEITAGLREEKQIDLTFEADAACGVMCDPARTRQAILNILSNAIKFSDPHGRLAVSIAPEEPGLVVLSIADCGIGMTGPELEIAMTPFAQVSSGHTKTHAGTGLGLPLTKRLMEIQDGSLSLHSVKGSGTTVWLKLPRAIGKPAGTHWS